MLRIHGTDKMPLLFHSPSIIRAPGIAPRKSLPDRKMNTCPFATARYGPVLLLLCTRSASVVRPFCSCCAPVVHLLCACCAANRGPVVRQLCRTAGSGQQKSPARNNGAFNMRIYKTGKCCSGQGVTMSSAL
jgi:hypothetical protein